MIIISAMSEQRVIGSGDGMPWSVPEEYQQYLNFVAGNVVIMGRRSYDIFGPDLPPETTAIALTRRSTVEGARVASSLEDALQLAAKFNRPVFVAGGGTVYEQALPLADNMYLSTIKGQFEGDTYFPEFNTDDWEVVEERDEPKFLYRNYRRKEPPARMTSEDSSPLN